MNRMWSKTLKAIALLTVLLHGFSSTASATPNYVVVGYAPGWNSNPAYNFSTNFPSDVPWSDLTHVYFAFALVNNTTASMSDPNVTAAAICTQAHAHGVRCY